MVLDGGVVLSGLQAGLPGARSLRAIPGMVRRRLGGDDGVDETWLAFRELPGAVVQWGRPEEASAPVREGGIELGWAVPLPAGGQVPEEPGPGTGLLEVDSVVGPVTFLLDPAPERWRLHLREDGAGLRVGAHLPEAPVATVVVAGSGPERDAGAVLRRLENLSAEIRGWESRGPAAGEDRLRLRLPGGDEGRALAWALARLYSLPVTGGFRGGWDPAELPDPRVDASAWLRIGNGLLAAGSFHPVRSLLSSLADGFSVDRPGADGSSADPSPYLLLLARYLRWSGARSFPDPAASVVAAVRERLSPSPRPASETGARRAEARALRELADALEQPGGAGAAAALRDEAEAVLEGPGPAAPGPSADGGVGLPVLGGGRSGGEDERMASGPWAEEPGAGARKAFRAWRRLLLSGLEGPGGVWTTPTKGNGPPRPDPGAPAQAVSGLVFGLLGARADAAFGRLTLAPWIPEPWEHFEVGGLGMGDVRVGLRYRREGALHTFVVTPTAGRVPANLVFEPVVPATAVSEVRVDGEPADVEVGRRAGGSGVRLQLPLDSSREVRIVGDEHA